MTDAYLEPDEVDQLTRQLRDLGDALPLLDASVGREASRIAGSLVRSGVRPSSTPPLDVHALDLLDLTRNQITGWTRCLLDDARVEPPADPSTRRLCHHLATHADRIAQQQWAPDCADEIADTLVQVLAVIEPREAGSITEHHHVADAEVHHLAHNATGTAEDMAVVHRRVTGEELRAKTLYVWRDRGKLPKRTGPAGEVWFHYFEVAQLVREAEARKAKRKT